MNIKRAPISWFGGKFYIVQNIISMFPQHTCYVEPFGGAGHVLFAKDPSKVEVFNDLQEWLVNLYRMIRERPQELLDRLEMLPYSRSEYKRAVELYQLSLHDKKDSVTDPVEKAALFFMLVKQAFNSTVGGTWAYSSMSSKGSAWRNAMDLIMPCHQRLRDVIIECLGYEKLFEKWDGPDTLFYLDPPYVHITRDVSSTKAYEFEMSDTDHSNLCWECSELKGMVIMSGYHNDIYDSILVDELGWGYKEIEVNAFSSYKPDVSEKPKRIEVLYWNERVESQTSQMTLSL